MVDLSKSVALTSGRRASAGELTEIIRGAIDTHCHSGPSLMPRDLDHVEAVREALDAGMRAVIIKDHYYSAAPFTPILNKYHGAPGFDVLGGVALNNAVGGLNPFAVEHSLKIGGRVVWMPTFSAANHISQHHSPDNPAGKTHWSADGNLPAEPLTVLDSDGKLKPEVDQILELIAAADAVLAGGHLHISEIFVLFEAARSRGISRLLVNHPTFLVGASDTDIRELAKMGAFLEHSICMFDPHAYAAYTPEALERLIRLAGVSHTILGSDLGQKHNPHPVDGFLHIAEECLALGFTADEIRMMIAANPARLFGLDQ